MLLENGFSESVWMTIKIHNWEDQMIRLCPFIRCLSEHMWRKIKPPVWRYGNTLALAVLWELAALCAVRPVYSMFGVKMSADVTNVLTFLSGLRWIFATAIFIIYIYM